LEPQESEELEKQEAKGLGGVVCRRSLGTIRFPWGGHGWHPGIGGLRRPSRF